MSAVFADTGYWFALNSVSDGLHQKANTITQTLGNRPIITTQMVLTEFLDGMAMQGPYHREIAALFVKGLATTPNIRIIANSPELFAAALELYTRRLDKGWSLTDCASFVICQQEGITETLAHDQHFAQAGLIALLR